MRSWLVGLSLLLTSVSLADKPITITLIHTNDLHAHIEPIKIKGSTFGGYARQATIIKRVRATEPNVLLLSAGDTFQGTLFFNTYEGLADLAFMNAVGYQAMAVGNHEFDRGPKPLGLFATLAAFPLLSANLDVSGEPALAGKIHDSTVVTVGGEKIGIVGATTPAVTNISSPGPTVKLKDLHDSVQASVDGLLANGIHKIILVTHIGYDEDQALVKTLHGVAFVVGGHSHTPLGTPDLPAWPKSQGAYPTVVKDSQGVSVPIVQCWEWGKVFGHITLDFDAKGRLVRWRNATPIVVDSTIPDDPTVASMVAAFKRPIEALASQAIGEATSGESKESRLGEDSSMADVIADGMLTATQKGGSVAAFVNTGGVRGGLEPGKITYGELISIEPFGNTLVTLDLTGAELRSAIEEGIGTGGELIPSEGSSYVIDKSKPTGSRAGDITIAGSPLDLAKTYRITFLNFTANGGDAHDVLKGAKGTRTDTGLIDLDALIDFVKGHSPLGAVKTGRIMIRY
ncbi:MAG: bifunctional metallophosphatase/5'-nucleotidase [Fimbriimonas sp.]|nr:bifunctional metallophosphatase/5'-nucleotidase [Fimbriimonas sp.]